MELSNLTKSKLLKSLNNLSQENDKREQLINELDVLSNLIISFYLEQSANHETKETVEEPNINIDNDGNY